ncbi:MAG TPA: HAD hydrolase family protein [Pyrinomonadaceae bacterium]|nr:HAD hydrolase family protein [Pyrinomonadaceae bacterium]HNU08176.1 HAD hydrolase family protein [Pyrinomonadaceae bacterium]
MKLTDRGKQAADPPAARRVRLLVMDCDGVLTDGKIYLGASGEELKVFHVQDGQGISLWHSNGYHSAIITGRGAEPILRLRTAELQIGHLVTRSRDKLADLMEIIGGIGLGLDEVAYVGDDIGDIAVLDAVGIPIAVSNCVPDLLDHALYVTECPGGNGAIREVVEFLLRSHRAP